MARDPSTEDVERFRADFETLTRGEEGRLGVAVSGGADSLALLLLARAAFQDRVEAATVDHGLRPESAAEARFVAATSARLGIAHAILVPDTPIEGNLPSAAREVRYRALERWAVERKLAWIATAHQVDDQAETLLMRLLRGAGLAGLSGIRARSLGLGEIPVVRPLLDWRREALARVVAEAGIEPVDDPTNRDPRYDRARIRRRLAESDWIEPAPLARSAAALAEADEAMHWMVEGLWRGRVERTADGFILEAEGLPAELGRRLVVAILARMEAGPPPRGAEVTRLLARLEEGGIATLAGVRCVGGADGRWRFEPAPPRRSG